MRPHSFILLLIGLGPLASQATPAPPPGETTAWLAPKDRLALVSLLVPIDPDGFILKRLPVMEPPQVADLAKAIEAKTRQPSQIPASWFHLAVGLALWEQYDKAIATLARHRAEPEERQSLRVFEAWLLERNGQIDEARSLYRSLAESADERRPILRQLIALELRQHRFQAALSVLEEARALQADPPSPTLEYLAGLSAFAVGDDLNAWKSWITLSRRPPSEQIPQIAMGLAALSLRRQDADAALGWFAQGMQTLTPSQRQAWIDSPVGQRVSDHPEYEKRMSALSAEPISEEPLGEFHLAFIRHTREAAKADVRIRLRIHEPYTEYRTLHLFDILPESAPPPGVATP